MSLAKQEEARDASAGQSRRPLIQADVQNRTGRNPEEFRAPKAYETLGGTNPRSSWTGYGDFDVRWPLRMVAATLQHGFPGATFSALTRIDPGSLIWIDPVTTILS